MPKRETVTKVSITFTDSEWEEIVNLYQQLDALVEDQYPEVTEQGLLTLINNMQRTLDCLLVGKP